MIFKIKKENIGYFWCKIKSNWNKNNNIDMIVTGGKAENLMGSFCLQNWVFRQSLWKC